MGETKCEKGFQVITEDAAAERRQGSALLIGAGEGGSDPYIFIGAVNQR